MDANVEFGRAMKLYDHLQYEQAIQHYDNALKLYKKSDDIAVVYHNRGLCYGELGRDKGALGALDKRALNNFMKAARHRDGSPILPTRQDR